MKHLRGHILIVVIILAIYLVTAFWLDQDNRREHERDFNEQQAMQTRLSAQSIEDRFNWLANEYSTLAKYSMPRYLTGDYSSADLTDLLTHSVSDDELTIAFFQTIDSFDLLYQHPAAPPVSEYLQTWLLNYWDQLAAGDEYDPVVTQFIATADQQLFGLLIPVFRDDARRDFAGILGLVLDFNPILEKYIIPVRSGQYGAAWVQDAEGLVIYDHEPETVGANVIDISATYPDLRRVIELMFVHDQGFDEYEYTVELGGAVERKLVAWSTAYVGNQRLTVALSAPDTEINANMLQFRKQSILLGVVLVLTLAVTTGYLYRTQRRTLEQLVTTRTRELESLTDKLEQRVNQRTRQLDQERTQLAIILEAMDDGVVFRQKNEIVYTNPALSRLVGFNVDEITRDPDTVFAHITSPIEPAQMAIMNQTYDKASERRSIWRAECQIKHKNDHLIDVHIYMAQLQNSDGEIEGTVEIIRDITREKMLAQQRDEFITNAAHELRMPLSNLKTRLYLLKRQPDRLHEHLEIVQRATDDLAELVGDLVDMAHFNKGNIQLNRRSIVLQHVIQSTISIQGPHAFRVRVTLENNQPPEPIRIFADYQRLIQTFNNLLANAINTTTPDGHVVVKLFTETTTVHQWAVIQVQDNGPAISHEQLSLIFEPFYRPSEGSLKHTGMDLALAKQIIEGHGGTISASSNPGEGNTFTIQLPIEPNGAK